MKTITAIEMFNIVQKAESMPKLKNFKISKNFNWGEVFRYVRFNELKKMHVNVYHNAVKQSYTMETVRRIFGDKPVNVHSWVRSKARNERVGGAEKSQHLYGLATDFSIQGYLGYNGNKKVQLLLDNLPFMQKCGLEYTNGGWTHVDSRGTKARFHHR